MATPLCLLSMPGFRSGDAAGGQTNWPLTGTPLWSKLAGSTSRHQQNRRRNSVEPKEMDRRCTRTDRQPKQTSTTSTKNRTVIDDSVASTAASRAGDATEKKRGTHAAQLHCCLNCSFNVEPKPMSQPSYTSVAQRLDKLTERERDSAREMDARSGQRSVSQLDVDAVDVHVRVAARAGARRLADGGMARRRGVAAAWPPRRTDVSAV